MEGVGPPYSAKSFANMILAWANDIDAPVTPLKLQKMLFFLHADYLCRFGSPLISEEFEAWSYGPVIPSVYAQFKEFSRLPITKRAVTFNPVTQVSSVQVAELESPVREHVRSIFDLYIGVDAGLLSAISHKAGGPWHRAFKQFEAHRNINRVISNELIATTHNSALS